MRKKEIKAMGNIIYSSYLLQSNAHNFAAAQLYDAGWRKQIEAEWIPVERFVPNWGVNIIHHYECSNCKILEYTSDKKYCSNCGAKMIEREIK